MTGVVDHDVICVLCLYLAQTNIVPLEFLSDAKKACSAHLVHTKTCQWLHQQFKDQLPSICDNSDCVGLGFYILSICVSVHIVMHNPQ